MRAGGGGGGGRAGRAGRAGRRVPPEGFPGGCPRARGGPGAPLPREFWGPLPAGPVDSGRLADELMREAAARALPPSVDLEKLARDLSQEAARRSGHGPELSEELMGELAEDLPPPGLRGESCPLACAIGVHGVEEEAEAPVAVLVRSPAAAAPTTPAGTVARWAARRMAAFVQAEWPGPRSEEWQL